jgi:hypothetical protein
MASVFAFGEEGGQTGRGSQRFPIGVKNRRAKLLVGFFLPGIQPAFGVG